ncbi:splicing factor U2af large subunit B-like protein, partial [Trifolium pratense]
PSSRGSGHESTRMRRRDGDRKSFHDHRDRHRDDKYEGRGKYDSYNRQRGRDYDRYVPFVGIMTMIETEIQGADMEHIQRDPGGNLDLDHGPDPLLNLK